MDHETDVFIRSKALDAAMCVMGTGTGDTARLLRSANQIEAYLRDGLAPELPKLAEAA